MFHEKSIIKLSKLGKQKDNKHLIGYVLNKHELGYYDITILLWFLLFEFNYKFYISLRFKNSYQSKLESYPRNNLFAILTYNEKDQIYFLCLWYEKYYSFFLHSYWLNWKLKPFIKPNSSEKTQKCPHTYFCGNNVTL